MATKTLISEEEYLRMAFPDREMEYVDGELVERSLPNNDHSSTQVELVYKFRGLGERLPLYTRSDLRLCVAPGRYRLPDVTVFAGEKPVGAVPSATPLVAIEIVSPDDTYADLMERLQDYHAWGVPHVWLADPLVRKFYVYGAQGLLAVAVFELPEYGVRITPEEIFR